MNRLKSGLASIPPGSNVDPSGPQLAMQNAEQAYQNTFPDPYQAAQAMQPPTPASPFAKPNMGDFTPESRRAFQESARQNNGVGDSSLLVKPQPPTAATSRSDMFKMEKDLRTGFNKSAGTFRDISNAFTTIQALPDSGIGDVALATKIMKMLDPGSVVRESELGVALGSTGLFQRMMNLAEKAKSGQLVNLQQRAEFKALANNIYSAAQGEFNKLQSKYTAIANDYGLNPERIVTNYSSSLESQKTPKQAPDSAPPPVEVEVQEMPKAVVSKMSNTFTGSSGYPVTVFDHKRLNGTIVGRGNDGKYYRYDNGKRKWVQVVK